MSTSKEARELDLKKRQQQKQELKQKQLREIGTNPLPTQVPLPVDSSTAEQLFKDVEADMKENISEAAAILKGLSNK